MPLLYSKSHVDVASERLAVLRTLPVTVGGDEVPA